MSEEVHIEEHVSPIKTPKQLIVVILLSFLVPITIIVMLSQLVTTGHDTSKDKFALNDEAVAARLKPIGQIEVIDPNAPKVEKTGKELVDGACGQCHGAGLLGAPKIGDKAGWAPRIGMGLDRLTQSAIKGIRQMPPRGGTEFSDSEIARAIVFMANESGASFKEPAAKPAPAAPAKKK
jgi:cytochrome c5